MSLGIWANWHLCLLSLGIWANCHLGTFIQRQKEIKKLMKERAKKQRREAMESPNRFRRPGLIGENFEEFESEHTYYAEELQFRDAMKIYTTALKFFNYVSSRGHFLSNDVLFYLEIQKYKDFCHQHKSKEILDAKVKAMLNTFINSKIPPALQVDLHESNVKRIIVWVWEGLIF